jgi:hypothetical protein
MFNLIKIGLSLKKWGGVAVGLFSKFRIYFIVGGLLLGFFTVQHLRIKSKTKTIINLKAKIQVHKAEYQVCESANESNQFAIKQIDDLYKECTNQFTDAMSKNEIALAEVKGSKKTNEIKFKTIKERVIVNTCIIDDDNIKLLKEANNQN